MKKTHKPRALNVSFCLYLQSFKAPDLCYVAISPPKTGAESPVRDSDSLSDHEEKNTAPDFEEYEDAVTLTP